jgi:hypothetical protein
MHNKWLTNKEFAVKTLEEKNPKANIPLWDAIAVNLKAWERSPTVPEINRSHHYLLGINDTTSTSTDQ